MMFPRPSGRMKFPRPLGRMMSPRPPAEYRMIEGPPPRDGVSHRWRRWNLRGNPMGALSPDGWADAAVVELGPILDALRPRRGAVELIGPTGRGKTTTLFALLASLRRSRVDVRYHYFPPDGPGPPIADADVILIDEIRRLPGRHRRSLMRGPRNLVWTAHRSCIREARRSGRSLTRLHVGPANDWHRIRAVVDRRLELFRDGPGPLPRVTDLGLRNRFASCRGNVRSVLDGLYPMFEQWADQESSSSDVSATTGFRRVPMPCTVTEQTSPGRK